MQKHNLHLLMFSLTIFFISTQASACSWTDKKVKGNGNVTEQQRNVEDFNAIAVSEGLNVFLEQGSMTKVRVVADENLQEYILTEVNNGTLKIHVKNNIKIGRSGSKDIYVTLVNINSLKASSGSRVVSKPLKLKELDASSSSGADMDIDVDAEMIGCTASSGSDLTLKGNSKDMTVKSSSGADMNIEINTDNLTCKGSSGSEITLKGKTRNITADASSSGDIDAFGLMAETCLAEASSGSEIDVSVSKELEAHASSGGKIEYRGDPKLDIHKSSGGDVEKD